MTNEPVRNRHRGARIARLVVRTILFASFWLAAPVSVRAADYLLGPQDRVRVKLVEWRPGTGEAIEWKPLTDEYEVGASGSISLPLLGEFIARGRTTSELGTEIADRLKTMVGLTNRPEASVEVASYRPIYVLGAVDRPGEYKYRPDLTALQAIGIAGGAYRPADGGLLRLERDRITALGARESALLEWQGLTVRRVRLQAEAAGKTTVAMPAGFKGVEVDRMVADETKVAESLDVAFKSQVLASEQLRDLLDGQISVLQQKIVSQDRQVTVSRRELDSYNTLGQGLAMASRTFALERALAETTSRRLDYEMALLTAQQDRRKAQQAILDARNERGARIVRDLADVSANLSVARSRLDGAEQLVTEASVMAPFAALTRQHATDRSLTFQLVRRNPDGTVSAEVVDENVRLAPGDVLRVVTPIPAPDPSSNLDVSRDRLSARTQ